METEPRPPVPEQDDQVVEDTSNSTVMTGESNLLREWIPESTDNANSNSESPTNNETTTGDSINDPTAPPPVVAPAIVLNETSEDSNATPSRGGVYPVATFVSNFVRTSVSTIQDHLGHASDDNDHVSSIRSEPALGGALVPPESLGDEFVLIDGDLVAIPSSHQQYHRRHHHEDTDNDVNDSGQNAASLQNQEEDQLRQYHSERPAEMCQPNKSRVKRSVRGLKKWIKRKGRRNTKAQARDEFRQVRDSRGSQEEWEEDELSTTTPPQTSLEFSTSSGSQTRNRKEKWRNKKDKRNKRRNDSIERRLDSFGGSSSSLILPPQTSAAMPGPPSPPRRSESSASTATTLSQITTQPPPAAAAAASAGVARATTPSSLLGNRTHPDTSLVTPSSLHHRSSSIAAEASFVGNADQLVEAGVVIPDSVFAAETTYIEDRLDDYDKYEDDEKKYIDPLSRLTRTYDADLKVDKQDAPCVESMLRRAGEFARDLEASVMDSFLVNGLNLKSPSITKTSNHGKSDGKSVPLSIATIDDTLVHNDILKIVMVGAPTVDKTGLARLLRKKKKFPTTPRKRTNTLNADVHSWTPPNEDNVKFQIWTVQGNGCDSNDPYCSNFGSHPGTQSLFFSDRSLYLLVWDLAANNRKSLRKKIYTDYDSSSSSSDEEDDYLGENHNAYLMEEANRQADRALQSDIEDRVLSWVDCIARRGSHSAILPVALVPSNMSPTEAKRRCDVMQMLLMEHTEKKLSHSDVVPPKVLLGAETVLCVSLDTNMGMDLLEETILAIATDASHSVFDHVGTPVPPGTVQVLATARRLKQEADHKFVSLDLLMSELPSEVILSVGDVMDALDFLSSTGELFYFRGEQANSSSCNCLGHYIILSRKWLVSALSCILRNDLKRELIETRRFMNMQCLYSNHQFPENHVTQALSSGSSSCPLLSSSDTEMLWQSMSFMREAADKSLNEHSASCSTMFGFLEALLVHTGVFVPLDIDRFAVPDNVYFIPSLLAKAADPRALWTYKSSEAYMTTLLHSWLFRDGTPVGLFEHVTVALLRDLYEFSHVVSSSSALKASANDGNGDTNSLSRSHPFPFRQESRTDFMESHDGDAIGHIKIHQINCWKSSLLVKIGCVFPEGNELRESFVEIFVSITDQNSPNAVASDAMGPNMQRLIVSGKGPVGFHGRKLWKGGYGVVLDSIKASLAHCTNVDRQVVCPECLAHSHASSASTWSWDSVRAAAESGSSVVRCMRGHKVDSNLITGFRKLAMPKAEIAGHIPGDIPKKQVKELLPSVVVVGLWDSQTKQIKNVGSGFIADKKLGLVVTAGHIMFQMDGRNFGTPYCGLENARAVIGVIPSDGDNNNAVFRYFAEIVADDIHNVDACVLRITSRMREDVDTDALVGEQPEMSVNIMDENLPALKQTRRYELEETVRILGFNQGGEGLLELGKHVNRSADFAKGYICKQFKMKSDENSNSDDDSSSCESFHPREEIVIMCPTISGHSGGPCVNEEGKVIGILSRADPVDRQRCYLAPSNELKALLNMAKKNVSRAAGGLKTYY